MVNNESHSAQVVTLFASADHVVYWVDTPLLT
jgi:hypothetical protein